MGSIDANGVWFYDEEDIFAPVHTMLNLSQSNFSELISEGQWNESPARWFEFYRTFAPTQVGLPITNAGRLETEMLIPPKDYPRLATVSSICRIQYTGGNVPNSQFRHQININQSTHTAAIISQVDFPQIDTSYGASDRLTSVNHVCHVPIPAGTGPGANGGHLIRAWVYRYQGTGITQVVDGGGIAMSVDVRPA
jgi:hypothetical protein